jgi:hypothetical protein
VYNLLMNAARNMKGPAEIKPGCQISLFEFSFLDVSTVETSRTVVTFHELLDKTQRV